MGCFFAQNLTVFEKPKPKDQSERDAVKPSVFAARLRAGLHEGTLKLILSARVSLAITKYNIDNLLGDTWPGVFERGPWPNFSFRL
jgi:hypothetical protein